MTIASEIQRIQTNIANAYDALEAKGATMPATENTDNLVTTIDTISGGGDVVTATNNTGNQILAGDKVWINESSGSYTLEDLSTTSFYESNLTPKGTPSIQTEVVASGFSASNYLQFSGTIPNFTTENCTVYIKFRTGNNVSSTTNQQLLCIDKSYINLFVQSGYIRSWDGVQAQNIASASTFTTYWVKFQTNGTNKSVSVSLDGQTYGTPVTFTDSTAGGNTILLEIGSYDYYPSWYFGGSIDLMQTYIKNADGDIVWRAIEYNPNTLTGYAQENIASGSTGDVLTLIQPTYYAYKDFLNRYVYCKNLITSTDFYYDLNARSDNKKASDISELTVPTRSKPKSVTSTSVTFNTMPYYRTEQDDLY